MTRNRIKIAVCFAVLSAVSSSCFALNIFDEFKNRLASDYLKPFAKDVGGLIGSADFHNAGVTGFPGFDIGVAGLFQTKPDDDNGILKGAGVDMFGMPMIQAEVGLPANFGVVLRGMPISGGSLIGGGVKYGVLHNKTAKFLPEIAVGAFYDHMSQDYLSLNHFSADINVGFDIPFVKPYAVLGLDSTKIESKVAGVNVSSGDTAKATAVRAALGVSVSPFPLTYLSGGLGINHGKTAFQVAAGARF